MQAPPSPKTLTRVTFGLFEADLKSGELRKAGYRIKLQALPFKVLTVLLEHAGEVVTREELQLRVWGPDVIVDFEHSLSNAIKKLREALGDSAENPRFIETLSRRGFRFIAPVGVAEMPTSTTAATPVDIRTDVRVAEDLSSRSGTDATPENSSPTRDRKHIYSCGVGLRRWVGSWQQVRTNTGTPPKPRCRSLASLKSRRTEPSLRRRIIYLVGSPPLSPTGFICLLLPARAETWSCRKSP